MYNRTAQTFEVDKTLSTLDEGSLNVVTRLSTCIEGLLLFETQTPGKTETSSVSYLMGSVDHSPKLSQQMYETDQSPPSSVIINSWNYAQVSSYLSKL